MNPEFLKKMKYLQEDSALNVGGFCRKFHQIWLNLIYVDLWLERIDFLKVRASKSVCNLVEINSKSCIRFAIDLLQIY